LTLTIQSTGSDAQDINWRSVFNHAYNRSLRFKPGDALKHGHLVESLKDLAGADSNGTAGRIVERAVETGELCQTGSGYTIAHDGLDTGEIRQRLESELRGMMQNGESGVIQSPTSSGKTYAPSTTRWRDHTDLTGDQPVVLLSGTTDARDEAVEKSQDSWVESEVLRGRKNACPLAGGAYDVDNTSGNKPISAPDGSDPSQWFATLCGERGLHISVAHGLFKRNHDGDLPCCEAGRCLSVTQWEDIPRDESHEVGYDVLHATHSFAQVPQLIEDCNVILDERPDFRLDMPTGRIRKVVTSYLNEIDAPIQDWEHLIFVLNRNKLDEGLVDSLERPDTAWFLTNPDSHALAPGIVEAIVTGEERNHDRWFGQTSYTYPTLNPDHEGPDQEITIRIVLDDNNDVKILQAIPDFSKARCVIGLDAHPIMPKWRGNTELDLTQRRIVDEDERHKWRRNQRNLKIIQVGDNKNSWTTQGFNEGKKVEILCKALRRKHGEGFRTGIVPLRFEDALKDFLENVGIQNPETIHFGNEKSIEDFDAEQAGIVAGCISPSTEQIKDWLALLDKEADPRRDVEENYQGQQWVGVDADVARKILADVRENGILQACGRYARSPQLPDDGAIVYVLTNVLPDAYVDEIVDDVQKFGEKEKQILNYISASTTGAAPREISENVNATKRHVHKTLNKCRNYSWMQVEESDGTNQPDIYSADRCPVGLVEL